MKLINSQKKAQQGFTLIELVVVIVILGILAVTAAPKFIDLTGDARGSVVEAVKGSLNSAADLAHAKALVTASLAAASTPVTASNSITVGANTIALNYGWPTATSIQLLLDVEDVTAVVSGTGSTILTYTHNDATTDASCIATYTNAVVNTETRPTINSLVTGC